MDAGDGGGRAGGGGAERPLARQRTARFTDVTPFIIRTDRKSTRAAEVSVKVKHLFWVAVLGAAALFAYDAMSTRAVEEVPVQTSRVRAASVPAVADDRSWIKPRDATSSAVAAAPPGCDGRTSCGQMTSCAEATHFLRHCPNTAMDGDGDGIPCESQWCR